MGSGKADLNLVNSKIGSGVFWNLRVNTGAEVQYLLLHRYTDVGVKALPVSKLVIVPFDENHLDAAIRLYTEVFAAEPWREIWPYGSALRRLSDIVHSPNSLGVAALRGSDLVGFALGRLEPYRDEEHYYLQEMCVAAHLQRQGIGKRILSILHERLRERDCCQVYLLTARGSLAEGFYSKSGYLPAQRIGVFVKKLG